MDVQHSASLTRFYSDFLDAKTWAQRKDGVPLELLDNLSAEELKIAEMELISVVSIHDYWPIRGLGHIKSSASLPKLYELLSQGNDNIRVFLAHAIFLICQDAEMLEIVINETRSLAEKLPKSEYYLIDIINLLPDFNDNRTNQTLLDFCDSDHYLIAYNAARVLGHSTDDIVSKARAGKYKYNY